MQELDVNITYDTNMTCKKVSVNIWPHPDQVTDIFLGSSDTMTIVTLAPVLVHILPSVNVLEWDV